MSLATGYKDILILQTEGTTTYEIFGLSPAGNKWLEDNIAFGARVVHSKAVIDIYIEQAMAAHLSIEARGK